MRTTSDLYKTLLADPAHVKENRLTIGGVIYEESQIVSLSTSELLFAQDTVSIGGAVAREIDFAAFLDESVPKRAQIIHEVRLKLEDEVSEWLQKGVYYIDTRSRDPLTGVTTVHGFDAMLMAEQEWIPPAKDKFPMSMKEAVELTAAALGLEIDSRTTFKTGNAYKVDYPVADADESEEQQAKGLSIRQMWRWVAAAHGGNFIINDVGQLRLVPLNALPAETGYLVTEAGSPITFGGVRILLNANASGGDAGGDKVFVGNRAMQAENIPALEPIRKIVLKVDNNNAYVSGSDTGGLTLEADCAYGSKQMADDLLTQLQGYVYRPVQAEDALIDPAAELGDGITISGVYTVLAQKDTLWDALSAADIGAPGNAELESEFRFTSSAAEKFQYQLATTRSLIAKNSEAIELKISSDQAESLIKQTLNDITLSVSSTKGVTSISLTGDGVSVKAENLNLSVNAANIEGTLTANQINATNLHVNAANIDGVLAIGKIPSGIARTGDIPTKVSALTNDAKYQTESGVTTIIEGVVTTDYLYALGVSATYLRGETVLLKDEDDDISGGIEIRSASTAGYAVDLWSYGSLSVDATGGALYLGAEDGYIAIEEVDDYGYQISCGVDVIPSIPGGSLDLGHYYYQWGNIYSTQTYAEAAEADTSDRNKKNSITYDLARYDAFFDLLLPAAFKLNNGTSGRLHMGMIAQDVEQALAECGIPTSDFAGFIKIEDSYALRYGEFIALLIDQVQKLKARVTELEVKA